MNRKRVLFTGIIIVLLTLAAVAAPVVAARVKTSPAQSSSRQHEVSSEPGSTFSGQWTIPADPILVKPGVRFSRVRTTLPPREPMPDHPDSSSGSGTDDDTSSYWDDWFNPHPLCSCCR